SGGEHVDVARQGLAQAIFSQFKLITALQIHPELGGVAKEAAEAQRGVSGDSSLCEHNFIDAARRDMDGLSQAVLAQVQRFEKLEGEYFTGMNRRHFAKLAAHSAP